MSRICYSSIKLKASLTSQPAIRTRLRIGYRRTAYYLCVLCAAIRFESRALFLKSPGGGKVETVLTLATQRLPDLFPRADLAAGISLYQSELSISRIAADEMNRNTLMLVSGNSFKGLQQIASAGFLKHCGNEIDQPHLVNPTCFVLRIDMGESRRD